MATDLNQAAATVLQLLLGTLQPNQAAIDAATQQLAALEQHQGTSGSVCHHSCRTKLRRVTLTSACLLFVYIFLLQATALR